MLKFTVQAKQRSVRYNARMKIAVIGAGASGMTAALQAAWLGADVTLFESNATMGRKLLVTGSGHCNITNDAVTASVYTCGDECWMGTVLSHFGVPDLLSMLETIGIPARKTFDGWYYPLSNSAHSVVEAFSSSVQHAGILVLTGSRVLDIRLAKNGFVIRFCKSGRVDEASFDRVIVSAGGCAYPSLGSRGDLFPVLEHLGHTVLPARPALAPMLLDLGVMESLQGVRLDVEAGLWKGERCIASSRGNLIFTEWGLNGPAVMNISHHVTLHPAGSLELSLDLLAFFQDEFDRLLEKKRQSSMPAGVFLDAFFSPKVSAVLLERVRIPESTSLVDLDDRKIEKLLESLKNTRFPVNGVRGFKYCQVSAGGVPVGEVDPLTLESRRIKELYLTGETLDVVGPCGGFNLQFAFSSGALAGQAAADQHRV
ncbi:MAG: aminoacetone oxidase family FAD-binding enzyme [Leptolinea sp.]|nr:aminoacetone oxidase family FAD-binding enzyme [Leptolinea sp.]